ncbi:S9 family peptidase [Streptacidiphilus sp. P02-A3a]|nr:S9 family peptidase [Streptacidiphilus sp. P02-A3a]
MVFTGDAAGRCEIFTWDARTARARQVTDRPGGTFHAAIDGDGHVWWFDEDEHGAGIWRYQPFAGGPDLPGLPGVPSARTHGLAVSDDGQVALAVAETGTETGTGTGTQTGPGTAAGSGGTALYTGPRGGTGRRVARLDGHADLAGISPDGGLLALGGQARSARAVTVLRADGEPCAVLSGESGALWPLGFAPDDKAGTLLLVRERDGRYLPALWQPGTDPVELPWCAFDTEITARWCPDGRALLIRQERHGRGTLHLADLDARTLTTVPTPPGTLLDAAPRPGGEVHYLWTDSAHPARARSTAGTALPPMPGAEVRLPGTGRELWTPGPDGPVHTLVTLPEPGPHRPPCVFLVHGGPADHDRDAYDGIVHSLAASGFAVARVNYRGSTGYGPAWREAFSEGVGLTQIADLASVRADLVDRGWIDGRATALWGTSWGGYLALLALGVQPELWRAGVAVKPVADCAEAFHAGTPALRALDERLFGGTPDQVPERYARSSPSHYAARVRAPLLVVAAEYDLKCPPEQVRGYLRALAAAGVPNEAMWLATGHDGYDGGDHVAVLRRAITFLARELRDRPRTAPQTPAATGRQEAGQRTRAAPASTSRPHAP